MNDRLHSGNLCRLTIVAALVIAGGGVLAPSRALAQQPSAQPEPASDCSRCHTCPKPTSAMVCLPDCTRVQAAAEVLASKQGPEGIILLDMLKGETEGTDRFGPVPFDHSGHAKWAEISGGCTVCHHYTPEGEVHPACRTCHPPENRRAGADIKRPSLKGAYHRQCMGCHREWSHNTKCDACHAKRVGNGVKILDPREVLGHMGAPIPEPDTEIYEPKSKPAPGTKVIFRHKEHIHRFELKCAECHRGDNCARCHEEGGKHVQRERTFEEHHQDCAECHGVDLAKGGNCSRCHWKQGQNKPPPFDHANTGWPLSRYHEKNSCRACHKTARFSKLDRECNACHRDWDSDTFEHAVTGQGLDENHEDVDCVDCHADRKFDAKPRCDECHDEDEGFIFPNKRPGPLAKSD
ncbi:MAG: cytochrome c3 family protein [bacterium]|nr:cytochrome c3 family protein [bacterium]